MRPSNTIFIAMLTLSLCATVITTNLQNSVPLSYRMLDVVGRLYELDAR
ncbi:hypothetical protein [Marinomonas mediterranea]|nr:hypothetical protein [Marinomonas mediterranea]WCN09985.1 hypothetical protein GV055_14175 [Marinomonas mediterranea]